MVRRYLDIVRSGCSAVCVLGQTGCVGIVVRENLGRIIRRNDSWVGEVSLSQVGKMVL